MILLNSEEVNPIEMQILDLFEEFNDYMQRTKDKSTFLHTQCEYQGGFCE